MRVSDYTEAPYQGVSQAPAQVRLSTQAEEITDWMVGVPAGATPRPAASFKGQLEGLTNDSFAYEFITKPGVGDFLFTLTSEVGIVYPRLYQIDGLPEELGVPSSSVLPRSLAVSTAAQDYLDFGEPSPDNDIAMLTVEDYTFVLNRKVAVLNGATTAATRPYEAMLWVRQAGYSRTFSVTVTPDGGAPVVATVVTPSGKDASDGKDVDTNTIAAALLGGTYPVSVNGAVNGGSKTGTLSGMAGFTVTRVGEVIYLSHATVNFTIKVEDGQGGEGLLVLKDRVQAFSKLPARCPTDGFVVKITQQTGDPSDDFYVKFVNTAGEGTGVWEETIAPGASLGVDLTTMPIGLVYNQEAAEWTLDTLAWEPRTVGNETLAPDPGYVGTVLQDMGFWKGRLALLFAEGCRLSSATSPLRMYPSTLTQVLDDDAMEVVNPLTRQADFRYLLPFKRALILWGRKGQAQVTSSGQTLTPRTVDADPYSYYEFAQQARPQPCNDRIYFVAPRGVNASAVFEMQVQLSGQQEVNEGDDLSISVPRYIPPNINRVTTCEVNYQTIYGRTGDTQVTAHMYRYADRQRAQNAWQRWNLPAACTYAGGFFDNTRLYQLVKRDGMIWLLMTDTADGATDTGSAFQAHLDFRVSHLSCDVIYSAFTNRTIITVPYPLRSMPKVMVAAPGGVGGVMIEGALLDAPEGTEPLLDAWTDGSDTFTLVGDWTDAPLLIGEARPSNRIVLSPIFYRDQQGRPNRSGRLVLRKIVFDLADTAYLQCRVTVGGRAPRTYTFQATRWDDPSVDYDTVNLYTGEWSVPVGGTAQETQIELLTDSFLPAKLLGYSWEGEINPKATRIVTGQ